MAYFSCRNVAYAEHPYEPAVSSSGVRHNISEKKLLSAFSLFMYAFNS